jgi:hypothetical protein
MAGRCGVQREATPAIYREEEAVRGGYPPGDPGGSPAGRGRGEVGSGRIPAWTRPARFRPEFAV